MPTQERNSHSSTSRTLAQAIDHAAHYLPVQGPIGVFIHHNTLHAFQHLRFEDAVEKASTLFGTEPYMKEAAYRAQFQRGRILMDDLSHVLRSVPNAGIIPGVDRHALRSAMLVPGLRNVEGVRAQWLLEKEGWATAFRTDLPDEVKRAFRDDTPRKLWEACVQHITPAPDGGTRRYARPHDALFAAKGTDIDALVHPPLIDLVGRFLDQGVAQWEMPGRSKGLFGVFRSLCTGPLSMDPAGLKGLAAAIDEQVRLGLDAESSVSYALAGLGVDQDAQEEFLLAELLALPGWAGLVHKLGSEPHLMEHRPVTCSLMEYLAVRLTMLWVALRNAEGDTRAWRTIERLEERTPLERELRLFDVAQLIGLDSSSLKALEPSAIARLCTEIDRFDDLERRRVWHLAYERRHERMNLIPLAKHRALPPVARARERWRAEVFFCIDEREESVRRALEEIAPDVRTFGAAGFFGCAIRYSGNDDAHPVDLCPVVVKPAHAVRERPRNDQRSANDKRQRLRRAWASFAHGHHAGSRDLLRGWISSAITGSSSLVPLVLRTFSPLTWSNLNKRASGVLLPPARTELIFHRSEPEARIDGGYLDGFTTGEMADRVGGMLNTVGLVSGHARLVVFLGHGSTSLNNPHESAHDCGACGGRRGGANGRLFAAMANRPDVRAMLVERGVRIPGDSWFIGGYHDTCNDDIDLLDTDRVPATHAEDLERLRASLDEARAWSAHERSRRFEAADTDIDHHGALRHVQERAAQLAEPRPEYGHCTNAVCIVGRRSSTRGLFLDRRAFLVSYDAQNDPHDKALAGVLGAVIPVCGGISLEYYFSFVDNEGYGCGTKQPHNVTGLIGVMNGYQGDLRTGLPWQMVEIHEPVRILFVVETTPERLMPIIEANRELTEFVKNRWIRLSTMDPDSGAIKVYRDDGWEELEGDEVELARSASSAAFYSGHSEHLPMARIEPATTPAR